MGVLGGECIGGFMGLTDIMKILNYTEKFFFVNFTLSGPRLGHTCHLGFLLFEIAIFMTAEPKFQYQSICHKNHQNILQIQKVKFFSAKIIKITI